MRYFALATDYDGTLADDGVVSPATVEALERFCDTGRKVLLVTGRELPDLMRVAPRLDLFDRVVAENGALIYCPATREEQWLGEPPPDAFVNALRERNIARDLGLELQVIFNKGAVMVLPSGINKAAGLSVALTQLGLSPQRRRHRGRRVMDLLEKSDRNAIVNLLGIGMADRPAFFEKLLPRLQELRAQSGRPHWIVIDEAHHLLPTSWRPSSTTLPQELRGLMLITVHPDHIAPALLTLIDTIMSVGEARLRRERTVDR